MAPGLRSPNHENQSDVSTDVKAFEGLPIVPVGAANFLYAQDTAKQPFLPKDVGIVRKRKFGMDQPGIPGADEAEAIQCARESRHKYLENRVSWPHPERPRKSKDWESLLDWLEILKSIPEIWERITSPIDIGDIVEVFWDDVLNPIQICCSASAGFQLVRSNWPSTYSTPIFTNLPTNLTNYKFYFDDELSILFFSPLMSTTNIKNFTDWLGSTCNRFRRIAINHHVLEGRLKDKPLDLKVLTQYRNLKELIIVSEVIEPGDPEPLGPMQIPPQTVDFIFADSNQPRAVIPWDANDCRRVWEAKLQNIRDDTRFNKWPQYVKVDVVHIKRDGKLMRTEFAGQYQKDALTKMKDAEEDVITRAAKEEEVNDDSAYICQCPEDDMNDDFDDGGGASGESEMGGGSGAEDTRLTDDSSGLHVAETG